MYDKDYDKPSDMADETVLSADGVNPVSRDVELLMADEARGNDLDIYLPVFPVAYFPGYPGSTFKG